MRYLLNLLYLLLILLALPWLVFQAITKGKYREGYAAKLLGRVPRRGPRGRCVWLHAVSVGEVNLLAPLLKLIGQQHPDWQCVVSTTTMTGMALARRKYPELTTFYCPLDFSWAVTTAMRRIRPDVLVLAELELWPNLVTAARRHGVRVAVINGRLSEHSHRGYRRIRPLVRTLLGQIDILAVQDDTYAQRFRDLGASTETVQVTGSMKYDGAQTDRRNQATQRLAALAGIAPDDIVFLAGSTQEPEETLALDVYRQLREQWPQLRLILVPRHPERFDTVAHMLDESGVAWQRRTELGANKKPDARVLLVDVVGELGAWWGTTHIAFVGGSMGSRGGQNMIEPAAYGAAVSFGPNTSNFRDIVEAMLRHEAATVVRDSTALLDFVRGCLDDPSAADAQGARAQAFVREQLGATERTLQLLEELAAEAASHPKQRKHSCTFEHHLKHVVNRCRSST